MSSAGGRRLDWAVGMVECSESRDSDIVSILGIDSVDEELAVAASVTSLVALVATGDSGAWGCVVGRWEVGRTVAILPGTGSRTEALSPLGGAALHSEGCVVAAL